jgi:hypothetical protein
MNKPNFFIVGFPKCGTTALAEYLGNHPDVFISHPKEIHYFSTDLPGYQFVKTIDDYLALFPQGSKKNKAVGEASVYYLYSEVAIELIYSFNPNAKIIVMVRNPVDLAYSLHSQLLFSRNENVRDFQKAWELQSIRKLNKNIPPYCTDPKILQYSKVAQVGDQVKRLLDSPFSREQIKFIFFEDFVRDTKSVYDEVISFLGVQSDGKTVFPVVNPNTEHRFKMLGGFYVNTPGWLSRSVKMSKKALGIQEIGLSKILLKFNTKKVDRRPLSPQFRLTLAQHFASDIQLLEELLQVNLDRWKV